METPGGNFRSGVVEAGGFALSYAEAGPDDPEATIVSLPGSAGLEMSTAKDRLALTYRVIEINPPGWGGKTDLNRPMEQAELGPILAEAIGKLVDGGFYLIGTSMGGANALYVAQALADRVAGIILEGSMAPCRPEDLTMPPITKEQVEGIARLSDAGERPNYPIPPAHPNKPWATPDVIGRQMADRFAMMRWTLADMQASAAIKVVNARGIPVLALLGDQDGVIKLSQEQAYRDVLPTARFQVVPGGEHDLQNTTPDAFVESVERFIAANPV